MSRFDEWRPGVVEKRSCPWPYCHRIVDVYRHAPASDRLGETVDTIEQHAIEGPNSWYRVICPASHLMIPFSDKGREVLDEHSARFREALAERLNRNPPMTDERLDAENREIEQRNRDRTLRGPLPAPVETYFPPRPSDVEEVEGLPVRATDELHKFTGRGGQNVATANEGTISLIELAKQNISNAQEDMSAGTHIVELLDAKLKSVSDHLDVAGQLIAAAAQGSATPPRLADEGAQMIAVSSNHITDDAESGAAQALTAIHNAFQAAHHAVEKLDEFVAQISA